MVEAEGRGAGIACATVWSDVVTTLGAGSVVGEGGASARATAADAQSAEARRPIVRIDRGTWNTKPPSGASVGFSPNSYKTKLKLRLTTAYGSRFVQKSERTAQGGKLATSREPETRTMEFLGLPARARDVVGRIDALLDEASRLATGDGGTDEARFALRETRERYLPDTLAAYEAIPPSRRDAGAEATLVAQLELIERSTADRLGRLAEASQRALAANGAFLRERFADVAADAPVPAIAAAPRDATPATLVARFFEELDRPGSGPGGESALLERIATRFTAVFPLLTAVKRGPFGKGAVRALAIDVPIGADVMRYGLELGRVGLVASLTRIVRNVALRTERAEPDEWAQALLEDLAAFVERDRTSTAALTRLFAR